MLKIPQRVRWKLKMASQNEELKLDRKMRTDRMDGSGRGCRSCQLDIIENQWPDAWACSAKVTRRLIPYAKSGVKPNRMTLSPAMWVCVWSSIFSQRHLSLLCGPSNKCSELCIDHDWKCLRRKSNPPPPIVKQGNSFQTQLLWLAQNVLKSSKSGAV